MAENIEIKVQDKVDSSISTKFKNIASNARTADSAVKLLQLSLKSISASSGLSRLQTELAKSAILQQKLATETQKTQAAMAQVEVALQRAIAAEARANIALSQLAAAQAKASTESQKLATEQQRTAAAAAQATTAQTNLVAAQTNNATAAQRLFTAQQQTTIATANAAAATTRAATAATQGQTAQQNLATATTRSSTAQTQSATASQRLATEQQRTAVQTANAAAASDRAALATLRLQAAQDKASQATKNAGSQLAGYVRAAVAVAGVTLSAGAILSAADAYTVLQNKLQNVTSSQAQVNTLTKDLFDLANRTRAGVEETATAFTRFDRALKILGKSQEDSLRLTETVNKALVNSGATSSETASALLQLSQAFNAGKLQGDEFRSVSENMPIVLDAVAKATGQPINQIKKLASEGKITSEVLYNAFKLIESQVDKTFNKTTPTISQSMTVLKNSVIEFFGELNKSIEFTAGLSKAILWLADNMKTLAIVTTAIGAALLLSFGPAIVTAIASAAQALATFTLALASNPVGLLVVALSTAITYLTLFRDQINLGIDNITTFGDFARAAFEGLSKTLNDVKTVAKELWANMFNDASSSLGAITAAIGDATSHWFDNYKSFFQTNRTGWVAALEWTAKALDAIAGFIAGLATFAGRSMGEIVITIQTAIANSYNFIANYIEKVTNLAIEAANKLRAMVGKAGYELVNFERMGSAGQSQFESFGKLWAESLESGFNSQGGVMQKALEGLFGRAQTIGKDRRASASAQLRGAGPSQLGNDSDSKAAKSAERRALAMEKINKQLDNELSRMFELQPQREAQAKLDQIEESLIQRKIKLNDDERASLMAKIVAIQQAQIVQQKFDSIYNEAVGPQRDYNATLEAGQKLLAQGAISQELYSRTITKATEEYKNAQDPMRRYNRDLQQQFDLLNMLPKQREVEQEIMQVQNDLLTKGIKLNDTELQQLRERLTLLQQANALAQQEATLMANSVDKRQEYIDQLKAINELKNNPQSGFTSGDAASAIMGSNNDLDFSNTDTMFEANVSKYEDMYSRVDQLRQQDLINEQTAATLRTRIWMDQHSQTLNTASGFFGEMAQLQKSENSKLAAVGKAAAIAQALVNTYQAATGAYASLAPIPFVGPALGAAAAAAAIAAGLANVQQIRSQSTGFKEGGYTGSVGVNEVAGVVHGREYVMDANTTSRVGVSNLAALQSGAASVQRNGKNVGTAGSGQQETLTPQVNVSTPVTAVVVQSKESALAALKSSEGKAFVIEAIEENGGTVARIVGVK